MNPSHLEPVTSWENTRRGEAVSAINARKTVCVRGHALAGDNVYTKPDGRRVCKACRHAAKQAKRRPWPLHTFCPQGHPRLRGKPCAQCNRIRAREWYRKMRNAH